MGRFHVRSDGLESISRHLDLLDEDIQRAGRSAVNKTLTVIRKKLVNQIHQDTGISRKRLRARFRTKRAGLRRRVGYVVAESWGVPAHWYRGVTYEPVSRTRARVYVPWVGGGRKLVSGFINPSGKKRAPLRAWTHKSKLRVPETALAPSVAAVVKQIVDDGFRDDVRKVLAEKFEEALKNA